MKTVKEGFSADQARDMKSNLGFEHFERLDEIHAAHLLGIARLYEVRAGEKVEGEGMGRGSLSLIISGRVVVYKKAPGAEAQLMGRLGPGDFLGEIATLSHGRRPAALVAESACRFLSWDEKAIKKLSREHPHISRVLTQCFEERSLYTALALSPLFANFSENERMRISQKFMARSFAPEEPVLLEGAKNPEGALYLVKKGGAEVFASSHENGKKPVSLLKPGDVFGEYSVLTRKPATATVIAKTRLEVLALCRDDLFDLMEKYPRVMEALEDLGESRLDDSLLSMDFFASFLDLDSTWRGS